MAQFSNKEKLVASLLGRAPLLKKIIKRAYIALNAILCHKSYQIKTFFDTPLHTIWEGNPEEETFFGYYDKSPENSGGWVIVHETRMRTTSRPSAAIPISIRLHNMKTGEWRDAGISCAYNWQQGCRAHWIDDDRLIYNVFENGRYASKVYSLSKGGIVAGYPFPIQDSHRNSYFLSINYRRVMRLRPDYGYRNLPPLQDDRMADLGNDGIWKTDFSDGKTILLVSLAEIAAFRPHDSFKGSLHKVNHVMISPDGRRFIFIHRWYGKSGRRHDRLLIYDGGTLRLLADEDMVSHMCWAGNDRLFGFLRHGGVNAFYFIDPDTGVFTPCDSLNRICTSDGHPTYCNGKIAIDSYPDKSRMQHLYLYNPEAGECRELLEAAQSIRYDGETRCDLHPRFSPDGSRIYFDSVFSGRRRLCYIDISPMAGN